MSDLHDLLTRLHDFPTCGVGGPLHIVVDDLNVTDDNLDHCHSEVDDHWSYDEATPEDQPLIAGTCYAILDLLRPLCEDERYAAIEDWWVSQRNG